MNLHEFFIVCPLVFLAGFVDAIAGGGGLISLPAYMFAGVPVHNAIATNKLSSATGTAVSTWHLVKSRCVDLFLVPGTVACAFVGSIAGANLALIISDKVLKTVLVFVLPVVAFCVLRDKNLKPVIPEGFTRKKQYLIMAACSFVIGIYDGFYGPGTVDFTAYIYQIRKARYGESNRKRKSCQFDIEYIGVNYICSGREDLMGTGTFGIHIQHCRTLSWCTHGCEERGKGHQADYLTCARITDDQDYSRNIDGII